MEHVEWVYVSLDSRHRCLLVQIICLVMFAQMSPSQCSFIPNIRTCHTQIRGQNKFLYFVISKAYNLVEAPGGGGHSTLGYAPCATKKILLFFARFHRKTPIFTNFHPMTPYFSKISTFLTKCWEIFGHFGPESAYFLMHFTKRPPIFVHFVTERSPFLTQFVTERPLHLRCLVALVRHFHMWVPPPGVEASIYMPSCTKALTWS